MADHPPETDTGETPTSGTRDPRTVRAASEASAGRMVLDPQSTVGEVKEAVAALSRTVEKGLRAWMP